MTFDEVRVIRFDDTYSSPVALTQQPLRTAPQLHTDYALNSADESALAAADEFGRSLAWATSIGVEIPSRIKGVVTILGQWQKHLDDERKRRG